MLECHGVSFSYKKGPAVVRDVTCRVAPGRVTVLLGPNAAGKSTLLALLLGRLVPGRGRVTLLGRDVHAWDPRERARRMAYVPQRGDAGFAFSVREMVGMGLHPAREAAGWRRWRRAEDSAKGDAAVDQALRDWDLAQLSERAFTHLSGGQQQRVLLARAAVQIIAGDRRATAERAMLLDEPSNSLDLRHVHAMMVKVRAMTTAEGGGMAALVVLHDLNLASRYADDVWLMHEGHLVAAGEWPSVLRAEVLEPVYGVRLARVERQRQGGDDAEGRPVWWIDSSATSDAAVARTPTSAEAMR